MTPQRCAERKLYMSKLKPDLAEEMRALARFERKFGDGVPALLNALRGLKSEPVYQMTLDDLCAALRNMLASDADVDTMLSDWYLPLLRAANEFGILEYVAVALGDKYEPEEDVVDDENDDDVIDIDGMSDFDDDVGDTKGDDLVDINDEFDMMMHQPLVNGLPLSDEDGFIDAWSQLDDMPHLSGSELLCPLRDMPKLQTILRDVEAVIANRGKDFEQMTFTDHQKERYIGQFESDKRVTHSSEFERELCLRYTEELITRNSVAALKLKGYACYGGNGLYDCDWNVSRDCMLRLYDLTDDPMYANTLGYIYYYGRCNDGAPEYEKAFTMFTVAAANGLYEAMYKLGDMYRHGYACKQSPRTAKRLYSMVYSDSLGAFEADPTGGNFADAALRMGDVFFYGIDEKRDAITAYGYYLQALYAARLRLRNSDFFGDTTVAFNAQKALEAARAELPDDYFRNSVNVWLPGLLKQMVSGGYRATVEGSEALPGETKLRIERQPMRGEEKARPMLLVLPQLAYCQLVRRFDVVSASDKLALTTGFGAVRFDCAELNAEKRRIEFYYDGKLVRSVKSKEYYIDRANGTEAPVYRMVSVAFQPGGRTYSYICDEAGVKPGDTVVVETQDGEAQAEVVSVRFRYESELALPVRKYKSVIMKL